MKKEQIAIIDFGSQYTHLITRRIRQLGVLAVIYPPSVKAGELKGIKALILSGGPQSVHDKTAISYDKKLFDLGVPTLGLCYGHQLIAQHFGGTVKPGKVKEYGFAKLAISGSSKLFKNIGNKKMVWMSHGDSVANLPAGFKSIGQTSDCRVAAMSDEEQNYYGLQFHPEVTHSEEGLKMLKNFVFDIAQCKKDWSIEKYYEQIKSDLKKKVGKQKVFLLVSGGVDSSVCFALLESVLGKKNVFGLHIDNGFMRLNESQNVKKDLAKAGFDDLVVTDYEDRFLSAVNGVIEPEAKRKIIGRVFLESKDDFMKKNKMNLKDYILAQGTIYPDTIETGGTKHADTIKTHHNRVEEILKLMKAGGLVEPIADLYKDEVRQIGQKLGLPKKLIDRHPFPGPGLSIRALCSSGRESVANAVALNNKINKITGKIKSVVLPLKSVGVQGDNRTYSHPVLLSGKAGWKELHSLSVRLTNEVSDINRVVYLTAPQKINFAKIKTVKSDLNKKRLDLLRQADDIVMSEVKKNKVYKDIWQFPVVLAPLSINGGETIILRPIQSKEAMTVNFYPMPQVLLNKITRRLMSLDGVDMVLYDVTNKPPGTIEWE